MAELPAFLIASCCPVRPPSHRGQLVMPVMTGVRFPSCSCLLLAVRRLPVLQDHSSLLLLMSTHPACPFCFFFFCCCCSCCSCCLLLLLLRGTYMHCLASYPHRLRLRSRVPTLLPPSHSYASSLPVCLLPAFLPAAPTHHLCADLFRVCAALCPPLHSALASLHPPRLPSAPL